MEIVHTPVMPEEVIKYLAPRGAGQLMIDATQGEGGHSYAFLSRFTDIKLIGVDADSSIQAVARARLAEFGDRVIFHLGWSQDFFAEYPAQLKRPDIILLDLGISLYHYAKSGRGFSFQEEEKLDMRLDITDGLSAADLLARLPEKELADLLYNNAGERYSRRIARTIVQERQHSPVTTTSALAELVTRVTPASYRHGPLHPATRTFQALRIAVNGELSRLADLLEGALRVLEPGGRLGIISFHSAEHRIIKNFIRGQNKNCTCPPQAPVCKCSGRRAVNNLTRKGIVPSDSEIDENPPSRSARLRVVEKVLDEDGQ
jgi:16S rRNA (cytosine1402-N4)-methyltransferase